MAGIITAIFPALHLKKGVPTMALKHSGKSARVTAKSFADKIGVDVSMVRNFQKMSKSYNDAARKWAARYGYEGQQWRPWSITAMSAAHGNRTPGEAFLYAYEELTQRLLEGVSKTLSSGISRYTSNAMRAMMESDEFLLNPDMQKIYDRWQAGKITDVQIFRALHGRPLRAFYTSKDGISGTVEIDFESMIDAFGAAGLI